MRNSTPVLVLASTSPFRKELLTRLGVTFDTLSPNVDETRHDKEPAAELVKRLAEAKARAGGKSFDNALVIGSDQVAVLGEEILGKPGNHENAKAQLAKLSGQVVIFLTGLCLFDTVAGTTDTAVIPFKVHFRTLDDARIERYLRAETPYNCAGSFKSEALGITLFEKLEGDDPTALIGLPLIELTNMLARRGYILP